MKKRIRLLSILLALVFCICVSVVTFYAEGEASNNQSGYEPNYDSNVSGSNDNDSDTEYYYFDDSDVAAGSVEDSAGRVSDSATLYDPSDINEAELKSNDWNEISLDLDDNKNTDTSDDFTAIKANTDNNDNGQWILYIGITLICLSVIGIIYVISSTVHNKKNLNALKARESRQRSGGSSYNDERRTSHNSSRPHQQNRRYTDDYGDSYSSRKRSRTKADTAEIYLPKRYVKK